MTKYATISLPKKFIQKINAVIIENPEAGYSSVAEFARDAIRSLLREIDSKKKDSRPSPEVPIIIEEDLNE